MKRNKELIDMNPKVNVFMKILPFGTVSYEITGVKHRLEEKKPEIPRYLPPQTTNIKNVEIPHKGSKIYSVPRTTA